MEFSTGDKSMRLSVHLLGPKVKITAYGSALMTDTKVAAKPAAAAAPQASSGAVAKAAVQVLEADPDASQRALSGAKAA